MTTPPLLDRPTALAPIVADAPDDRAFARFLARLEGRVSLPGSPAWDTARRSWNLRYDPRPLAIVRAANPRDVAATVRFAREHDVPLTIRSGGHSLAGYGAADGALLLDLADLRSLDVDPVRRVAVAGPGLRAQGYSAAAAAHGLGTPLGDTASVGLGGLVTGGGVGWLTRAYGMTIDSLVSAEVVTADGDIRTIDADREPELFWGIRGGGGNFGIATRLTLRLHPVDRFLGGAIVLPPRVDVVRALLEVAHAAPDGLTLIPTLMRIPPLPFVASAHHGTLGLVVLTAWVGDLEAGRRAVAPIRAIAPAWGDMVAPMPYPAIYGLTEAGNAPTIDSSRSAFLDEIDDDAVRGLIEGVEASTADMTLVQLRVLGGAMGRVAPDATAFAHRSARIMAVMIATSGEPARQAGNEAWAIAMHDLVASRSTGVYVNFLHREGPARIRQAYPGVTYERLVALKRRWDPTNLFRYNQNIAP